MLVRQNMFQIYQNVKKWCHLRNADLLQYVQNTPRKLVICTVHIVTFLSACSVLLRNSIDFIKLSKETKFLKLELLELKNSIYPIYQEIAFHIRCQKVDINKNSKHLSKTLEKRRKLWHSEIDIIIKKMKFESNEVDCKHMAALRKQEDEITRKISEISQAISDLKKMIKSNDVCLNCLCIQIQKV